MGKFKLACHLIQFAGEQNAPPKKCFEKWPRPAGMVSKASVEAVVMN